MDRYRSIVDVHLILVRDGRILLGLRRNTGYADGHWHLPSGHLEKGESLLAGIIREAEEEIGLRLAAADLRFVQLVHHADPGEEPRVGVFFEATRWTGEPVNAEPHKCAELRWFPAARIPAETLAYPAEAIARYLRGEPFAVHGL
ncbi:DNA mismatch repair protein MutT [Pilimelia anulata]|uniref:DNA mismatch repair protein MutT n=1 Tax=Pilimelia anulata TaxID=53371 RepID=A0A8J3FBE2_9ACTN|nr:NUDIX domain-containing protein [Pilimelia anulata]GGK01415.1 DNA mismatch repair protein MutT [Pilimelia anulata]